MPIRSFFPYGDPDVLKLLKEFGGWERVLDPNFEVPEEVYLGFTAAGYTRERLDEMRAENPCPEREAWLKRISRDLNNYWRMSYSNTRPSSQKWCPGFPGHTPGVRWQDYPGDWQDQYGVPMDRLSITWGDIDDWINNHPDEYPLLDYYAKGTKGQVNLLSTARK